VVIERAEQISALDAAALLPGILKTARLGYDGKGQARVTDRAELMAAWERLGRVTCVLERMLPLAAELSVIVAAVSMAPASSCRFSRTCIATASLR
jgi:5-(carboxyamino)imidazole ribonucleotide synthase